MKTTLDCLKEIPVEIDWDSVHSLEGIPLYLIQQAMERYAESVYQHFSQPQKQRYMLIHSDGFGLIVVDGEHPAVAWSRGYAEQARREEF